ncbi:MAG: ribonuclease P protein component [Rhodoferax sp.]
MLRLKTRAQFQAALAGKTLARTSHFVLHACALPSDAPVGPDDGRHKPLFCARATWLGAMIPKRWARRSVTRHLIKRQIYAVAAEHAQHLGEAAHVVRLRSAFDPARFAAASSEPLRLQVRQELQQLFAQGAAPALARSGEPRP